MKMRITNAGDAVMLTAKAKIWEENQYLITQKHGKVLVPVAVAYVELFLICEWSDLLISKTRVLHRSYHCFVVKQQGSELFEVHAP